MSNIGIVVVGIRYSVSQSNIGHICNYYADWGGTDMLSNASPSNEEGQNGELHV